MSRGNEAALLRDPSAKARDGKKAGQPLRLALRPADAGKTDATTVSALSAAVSRPARLSPDVSPETMKISGSCGLM